MSGYLGQFAVKSETTWNTPVVPDKAFEVASAAIKVDAQRVEVPTIRAGRRMMKHRLPYAGGASGSVEMPVMTTGFGWWLKHMLGSVASSAVVDSAYTHTGTMAVPSASFTAQTGVPYTGGSSVQPQTVSGGRVTGWELSCEGGGELKFKADCDFASWTNATALVTPVYPSGVPLTFIRGSVTIDGTPVISDNFTLNFNPALNTDRRGIGVVKREQKVDGLADASLSLKLDYEAQTYLDKIVAATQAGAQSNVVIVIEDTALIGATSRAKLEITIPVCMWDGDAPSLSGPEQTSFDLKGVVGTNDTDSPVTIKYVSTDSSVA